MWWPFRKKKHKIIKRDDLKLLIFKAFDGLVHEPLDMRYKVFDSKDDVVKYTPHLGDYKKDFSDCDDFAGSMMSHNYGRALGMIRVAWTSGIDHVLNIVVISNELLLYDPSSKLFYNPEDFIIKGEPWI